MMLTEFSFEYTPRPAIKGQALADFVVECSARDESAPTAAEPTPAEWEIATDGSSCKQGACAGVILTSPEGLKVYYALSLSFSPTNNEAEYEAFIAGLRNARSLGARWVRIRTDSALVIGQVTGAFEAKGERFARYLDHALSVMGSFDASVAEHIPRAEYADADMLSRLSHEAPEYISKVARVEELPAACIDVMPVAPVAEDPEEWISDLRLYLQTGTLPKNDRRERKVKLRAPRFQMLDNRSYRRLYEGPLMRCLSKFEADLVMTELHSGLCSAHQGGRALARRIMLIGYYWPSIQLDCESLAKSCESCQLYARVPGRPATFYHPVSSAILFAKWGVDILGPFPQLTGRRRFITVAIDYFSKWIEAEPLATITFQQCARFLWQNVMSRFGVPVQLVTDNGK
ncbi:uncharacterized protein LOC116001233 [Ipomoea triloba]|uniref:uncharacterized protein LOC116001233 n=1 Tax=Ipomoea triloba TaxID=35885 RepID=UPI00125D666E|nr:uncharacterized protein LOC116001233 [Ipomoea triloba]